MEERFNHFMDNHWPTMMAKVGRIEGQQKILLAGIGLLVALVGGLIALAVKG